LNAAQGKQAGFESDEFGAKGLGTKLLYNSSRVEMETWDGGEEWYRVILEEPRKRVLEDKELCEPVVYTMPARPGMQKKGTRITVKGWAGLKTVTREFKMDALVTYLAYYTVVGYTRLEDREMAFPVFELYVGGQRRELEVGFPYITPPQSEDSRTAVFGPIPVERKHPAGQRSKSF